MNINTNYDVFIAFHDSSGKDNALNEAKEVYEYLTNQGIKCFLFSEDHSSSLYKANFLKIMQSRLLVMVCNSNLKTTEIGEIDYKNNYHLYVELDTFYAMTQSDEGLKSINDSAIVFFNETGDLKLSSSPEKLHPLFNNRNSFFIVDPNDGDEPFEQLLEWVEDRLENYDGDDVSNELVAVMNGRGSDVLSSNVEGLNFKRIVRKAKKIKTLGISNWTFSLTDGCKKLKKGLGNGTVFELLYLDPDGEFVKLRSEEEQKDTRGQIVQSFDMMKSELNNIKESNPEALNNLTLFTFDMVPRDNLIFVYGDDVDYLFVQNYAHAQPGSACPCSLYKRKKGQESPLFEYYEEIYNNVKNNKNTKEYSLF